MLLNKDLQDRIGCVTEKLIPTIIYLDTAYESPNELLTAAQEEDKDEIFKTSKDTTPENKYLIENFSPVALTKIKIDLLKSFKTQYTQYKETLEKFEQKNCWKR